MNDPFMAILDSCGISGWLRDFVDHTENTESPASFRFFTGLTVVASMLRRRIHIPMGHFNIMPPTKIMLSGPAGASKKSVTAAYGISMTKFIHQNPPNMLPGKGSPEALWAELHEIYRREGQACGLLFVSELATLMGKQEYAQTYAQMLTDLFDDKDEDERKTISGGKQVIKNIGVSAILCSNETWLSQAIPATAVEGGLPSRMLLIHEQGRARRVTWPGDYIDDIGKEKLGERLDALNFKYGPVVISPKAKTWVDRWYQNLPDAPVADMQPFFSRLQIHLLRTAMVISAQENDESRVQIETRHVKQADAVLQYLIERQPELYRILETGRFGKETDKVREIIRKAGGEINRKDLGKQLGNMSVRQVNEIIETLVTNGELELLRRGRDYFCRRLDG